MPTLQFKGKTFVQHHHLAVRYHRLIPRPEISPTDRHSLQSDNLIIRGDNLLALKALLPNYAGQIKCIYIDPPYNTGNESWAYNDNVNSPMFREWLGKTVDKEDLTRHDKWCCMMYPRLQLLQELLSEDGAIFISIDDNEQHRLRMMLDEIFGEENFVATIVWHKVDSPKNTAIQLSEDHEFIILYAKNSEIWRPNSLPRTEAMIQRYKNPDADPRGPWLLSDLAARNFYAQGRYQISTPSGRIIEGPPAGSYWRVSQEKFAELEKDGRIWWGESGNNRPGIKRFLSEVKEGVVPQTIWSWKDVGSTRHSKQELSLIMSAGSNEDLFITPKPVSLIKRILEIATDDNSLILDSFAGSGTTAQAVLELNKEDGGNRRFILVEMEEYAEKITAERVRRVIKGVPGAKKEALREGLGGSFSYFELGEEIEYNRFLTGADSYPSWEELARFVFFTATGEQLDLDKSDPSKSYVGESLRHVVWLYYQPDYAWLRANGFTLAQAEALPKAPEGKRNLVFAPMKFVDDDSLYWLRIDYLQLPYEIYRLK